MAELLTDFVMEAEVTAKVGAEVHERSPERTTHRNGHRERRWDTRLGTLQLQVSKLREGGYVPSFIEHRKRSEQALIRVIQEAVVKGVSTRKIEAVLEELGIAGVSAGQVSQLCATLDEKVRKFREGPLGEELGHQQARNKPHGWTAAHRNAEAAVDDVVYTGAGAWGS